VGLSRVVRSMMPLQNIDAVDLAGFVLGIGCFLVIATLAALSPALRALKIDPASTLRDQ
jgi:ABC-type lipoprotein release transport system permease subunit